jgi:hypothetical protein
VLHTHSSFMSFIHVSKMSRSVYPLKCPVLVCWRRKCGIYAPDHVVYSLYYCICPVPVFLGSKYCTPYCSACICSVPCGSIWHTLNDMSGSWFLSVWEAELPIFMLSTMWYSLHDMYGSCLFEKQNSLYAQHHVVLTLWYAWFSSVWEIELPMCSTPCGTHSMICPVPVC